jgi:hypothetical protein
MLVQPPQNHFDRVSSFLKAHSAERIAHVNGDLLTHLQGTWELLREWGNPLELCLAGLCHAVYGTDRFPVSLLDISRRSDLKEIIGPQAEEIVYLYASCDRSHLYPQIGYSSAVEFRDRFTGALFVPDGSLFKSFLELTFANELEGAKRNPRFVEDTRAWLKPLFRQWREGVSQAAFAYFVNLYGSH